MPLVKRFVHIVVYLIPGAVKMYTEALSHTPNNDVIYVNLSMAYYKINKFKESVNAANTALHLTLGKSAKAWFRRGSAFVGLEDYDNAYLDFGWASRLALLTAWREALVYAPGDEHIKQKEDECADKLEELRQATEKWVNDNEYESNQTYCKLLANELDEIDVDKTALDKRGVALFYRTLADQQCKLTVLKLDGMQLGHDGKRPH